jgi:hypothetical protein
MKKPEVIVKFLGENNPFYGKKHSEESIKKISEKNKKYFDEHGSPLKGTKNNNIIGDLNPMRNPVFVAKLKETYRKNRSKYTGENSSRWKGGITKINELVRSLPEYNIWRSLCFARDNRTCQICKTTKSNFQVDHIKPFSTILHENNIKTTEEALQCKELWDIDNGRVLCVSCHRDTNTFGGRTKN